MSRLKKQQPLEQFSLDQFYVYHAEGTTNWQFRDRETQVVMSVASSPELLREAIEVVFSRYKTYTGYKKAMRKLSEKAISPKTQVSREKEHKVIGNTYNYVIEDILNKHLEKTTTSKESVIKTLKKKVEKPKEIVKKVEVNTVVKPKGRLLKRKGRL